MGKEEGKGGDKEWGQERGPMGVACSTQLVSLLNGAGTIASTWSRLLSRLSDCVHTRPVGKHGVLPPLQGSGVVKTQADMAWGPVSVAIWLCVRKEELEVCSYDLPGWHQGYTGANKGRGRHRTCAQASKPHPVSLPWALSPCPLCVHSTQSRAEIPHPGLWSLRSL